MSVDGRCRSVCRCRTVEALREVRVSEVKCASSEGARPACLKASNSISWSRRAPGSVAQLSTLITDVARVLTTASRGAFEAWLYERVTCTAPRRWSSRGQDLPSRGSVEAEPVGGTVSTMTIRTVCPRRSRLAAAPVPVSRAPCPIGSATSRNRRRLAVVSRCHCRRSRRRPVDRLLPSSIRPSKTRGRRRRSRREARRALDRLAPATVSINEV